MKSSASACPLDQISILTLQNCPYLRTVVHRIISYCWDNQTVPKVWKYGFTILIHKKGSTKEPGNFRPITLEPVLSKILSSVIRNRIYSFVSKNNYIETNLQKGFWDGIPGTIEHTELLTYIINHSRRKQRDMVITLLDLKNAFGEVSHDLLRMTLKFHHVPEEIISLINEFYTDYHVSVGTKSFVTDPIAVERGVLQGDCLSPILFNLCFNTLLRTIDEERIRLIGYYFNECLTPRHWFQFADDTAVITSSSEDNQLLLHVFSKWCTWSGLIVRVEKCKTFGVRKTKTTSIQYKPYLKICNEMVPQVEINDRFKYLGKEFSYDMTTDFVEAELKEDMTSYLKTLDSLPLHPHHKVSVITKYIYSKLRWRLSIYSISETWTIQNLDNVVNKYIRKWFGMHVGANITHLTMPPKRLGLNFKSVSNILKQCNLSLRRLLSTSNNKDITDVYHLTKYKFMVEDQILKNTTSKDAASKLLQTNINEKVTKHLDELKEQSVIIQE